LFPPSYEVLYALPKAPGIECHRSGGDFAPVFKLTDASRQDLCATFTCEDTIAQLTLTISIKLSESGVLVIHESLRNDAKDDLQLLKLAPTVPLPSSSKELLTFYGRWTREFQQQRLEVNHGDFIQEVTSVHLYSY
jgi:alpha-galactosidase